MIELVMNKFTVGLSALALLLVGSQAAIAQDAAAAPVTAKRNQTIIDADGRPLGKVNDVDAAAGYLTFTAQMRVYRVPLSTLSAEGARLKTTMTRKTIGL